MEEMFLNEQLQEKNKIAKDFKKLQDLNSQPQYLPYDMVNESEKITCSIGNLKMPSVLAQALKIIKKHHPGISENVINNMLEAKTAQLLTSKRIQYKEHANIGFPNHYATTLMPSGTGKDRILRELDNFVFFPFRIWFKCMVDELKKERKLELEQEARRKYPEKGQEAQRKKFVKDGLKEFRKMLLEVSDGTREGLYCDAKAFKQANFGSLMIIIAELGQYLNNMTIEQKLFFNVLFEGYDGIIRSKSIKGEHREEDIKNLPVNALLYSDPTLFKHDLKNRYRALMEAGMDRRTTISFMPHKEAYKMEEDALKAYNEEQQYFSDLKAIGTKLDKIFESVELNACYELTQETYTQVFYPYKLKLDELAKKEENSLLQKEINSRELKALKTACRYACINHPSEHFINPEDMEMAIDTVTRLGDDFRKFLRYSPKTEDRYDRLFALFLENLGTPFQKNKLVTEHYQLSGYSRYNFRKYFDECIEIVSEIAEERGFILNCTSINNNSGKEYTLIERKTEDLSDGVESLENLI